MVFSRYQKKLIINWKLTVYSVDITTLNGNASLKSNPCEIRNHLILYKWTIAFIGNHRKVVHMVSTSDLQNVAFGVSGVTEWRGIGGAWGTVGGGPRALYCKWSLIRRREERGVEKVEWEQRARSEGESDGDEPDERTLQEGAAINMTNPRTATADLGPTTATAVRETARRDALLSSSGDRWPVDRLSDRTFSIGRTPSSKHPR